MYLNFTFTQCSNIVISTERNWIMNMEVWKVKIPDNVTLYITVAMHRMRITWNSRDHSVLCCSTWLCNGNTWARMLHNFREQKTFTGTISPLCTYTERREREKALVRPCIGAWHGTRTLCLHFHSHKEMQRSVSLLNYWLWLSYWTTYLHPRTGNR